LIADSFDLLLKISFRGFWQFCLILSPMAKIAGRYLFRKMGKIQALVTEKAT
jgi:hypothetical protein